MTSRTERGREVVQQVFGGALYQQGRGFYSALELLAILRGEVLLEAEEANFQAETVRVLPPMNQKAIYLRPAHDHARRLLTADQPVVKGVFVTDDTLPAVQDLLRGIEAPVPGRKRTPDKWQLRHFYPYPPEVIHYDAVQRREKVSVERYQFRGAGGLAHRILRRDPDTTRLHETRSAVRDLLSNGRGAVGTLMDALAAHDAVPAMSDEGRSSLASVRASAFVDAVEDKSLGSISEKRPTRWMTLLRKGVHRLLHRDGLSAFDRVEGLMHWIPWCIAMHQLAMARRALGKPEDSAIVFDAAHRKSPLRMKARSHLGRATAAIKDGLLAAAQESNSPALVEGSQAWWKGSRAFFTTSLFAVGALNANSGKRHFVVRPQLLQTVVHALVDEPLPLAHFNKTILGEKLGMICDKSSASAHGEIELDGNVLESNGAALAQRLEDVGLLRSFSDSTRMVGVYS